MTPEESNKQSETIYRNGTDTRRKLFDLMLILMVPAVGWLFLETVENGNFRAATQANRFTSGDALRELGKMNERLARIELSIKEIPPAWFIRQVQGLESRVEKLEENVDDLEENVDHHEHQSHSGDKFQ